MIHVEGTRSNFRGSYKEWVGDFLRILIATDKNLELMAAYEEAINIFLSKSYIEYEGSKDDPATIFVDELLKKENMA